MPSTKTTLLTGIACAALLIASGSATASASPLPSYAQWQADVNTALTGVGGYLDSAQGDDAAIVLDIDNTALETHYDAGQANPPVLAAEQRAKKLGMTVLIVSARTTGGENSSLAQLEDAGYAPDKICLRKSGESTPSGKLRCRKQFTQQGYRITANIGNNDTDFTGGYYDRKFELPNYNGALS
jgi:hypothetical protein